MNPFLSRLLKWSIVSIICLTILVFFSYWKVEKYAAPFLYNDVTAVPYHKAALLLGTSAKNRIGGDNLFFIKRIAAATALYKAGKMKYIIVSGDNSRKDYNEPEDMRLALLAAGVPASAIVLDYAGFRTFDSIIRCKEVFGQSSFIIISQPFHNERAVYIARNKGIMAVGFNADDVNFRYSIKTGMREYLARVKVLLDVHLLPVKPRFGGQKVLLP